MKFSKTEMKKAAKTLRKSIGKKIPKSIKMKDTDGKTHKLTRKQYYGLFKQYNLFRLKHGRFPNYVTYNGKSKEKAVINY